MNYPLSILAGIILLAGLAACAPKHTVILVPEPDGQVGKAEVITDGGKQLLATPYAMTTVSSRNDPPSSVKTATPEFIAVTYAEALAIEPLPAERFIIYFYSNTSEVTSDSQATIVKILDTIKRRKAVSIKISGHTDSTGSAQLNEKLAYTRAHSISDLLIRHGVDAKLLSVSSHGKGNQLVPTADGVSEPRNRRVEVIVR